MFYKDRNIQGYKVRFQIDIQYNYGMIILWTINWFISDFEK